MTFNLVTHPKRHHATHAPHPHAPPQTSATSANLPFGQNCSDRSDLRVYSRRPPHRLQIFPLVRIAPDAPTCSADHNPTRPRTSRPPRPPQIFPLVRIAPTAPTCWRALADLRTGGKSSLRSELPPVLRPARRTTPTTTIRIRMIVKTNLMRFFERFVSLLMDRFNKNLSALCRLCLMFYIYL